MGPWEADRLIPMSREEWSGLRPHAGWFQIVVKHSTHCMRYRERAP